MTTLPALSAEGAESDQLVPRKALDADREGLVERFLDSVRTASTTVLLSFVPRWGLVTAALRSFRAS